MKCPDIALSTPNEHRKYSCLLVPKAFQFILKSWHFVEVESTGTNNSVTIDIEIPEHLHLVLFHNLGGHLTPPSRTTLQRIILTQQPVKINEDTVMSMVF